MTEHLAVDYASIPRRISATLTDLLLLQLVAELIMALVEALGLSLFHPVWLMFVAYPFYAIPLAASEMRGTLGHYVMHLEILRHDHTQLSLHQSALRFILFAAPFLLTVLLFQIQHDSATASFLGSVFGVTKPAFLSIIGIVLIGLWFGVSRFHPERKTIHDVICHTLVLHMEPTHLEDIEVKSAKNKQAELKKDEQ